MSVQRLSEQVIDVEGFLEICCREVYVPITEETLRQVTAKLENVTFRKYTSLVGDLLAARTSSAWDSDPDQTTWIPSDEQTDKRRPLLFSEILELKHILTAIRSYLDDDRRDRPIRPSPHIMTLHCAGCDSRWTLDGNNGFLNLCQEGKLNQMVEVTEITALDWQGMHRVCTCAG